MIDYVIYTAEGRILQFGKTQEDNFRAGSWVPDTYIMGVDQDPTGHYVKDEGLVPCAPLDMSHTIDGLTVVFPYLPEGTVVYIGGDSVEADAQGVEVSFEVPGRYHFFFYPPPQYMEADMEVTLG